MLNDFDIERLDKETKRWWAIMHSTSASKGIHDYYYSTEYGVHLHISENLDPLWWNMEHHHGFIPEPIEHPPRSWLSRELKWVRERIRRLKKHEAFLAEECDKQLEG